MGIRTIADRPIFSGAKLPWDLGIVQQVPDLGKKVLRVNRGITPLPDGAHQVVIRLADSRVYVAPILEEIETDPNWKTQSE